MTHVAVLNDVGNVILMLVTVETICPTLAHITVFRQSSETLSLSVDPSEVSSLWVAVGPSPQTLKAVKSVEMSQITMNLHRLFPSSHAVAQ